MALTDKQHHFTVGRGLAPAGISKIPQHHFRGAAVNYSVYCSLSFRLQRSRLGSPFGGAGKNRLFGTDFCLRGFYFSAKPSPPQWAHWGTSPEGRGKGLHTKSKFVELNILRRWHDFSIPSAFSAGASPRPTVKIKLHKNWQVKRTCQLLCTISPLRSSQLFGAGCLSEYGITCGSRAERQRPQTGPPGASSRRAGLPCTWQPAGDTRPPGSRCRPAGWYRRPCRT